MKTPFRMLCFAMGASLALSTPANAGNPRMGSPAEPEHRQGGSPGYHGRDDHHSRVVVNVHDHDYHPRPMYVRPAPVIYTPPPVVYYPSPPRYYYSHYYTRRPIPVEPAYDYVEVRCSSAPITGTVVGGVAGGLVANQFARGHSDRTLATVGGALLGAVVGHSFDRTTERCAYQALEYGRPNTQVVWASPNDDYAYTVIPGEVQQTEDGRYCREYQAKVLIDGRLQDGYGRACRQPDGSWEKIS